MAGLLDAEWLRAAGYGVAAITCVAAGVLELRRDDRGPELRPAYWFATAAVLLLMGVARAGDVGAWLADAGRTEAAEHGWYDIRRPYQALALGAVGLLWAVFVTSVAMVPERRRRYLAATVVIATLGGFAASRLVSLHQVDSVLYRHPLHGVRVASVVELGLLAAMVLATLAPFVLVPPGANARRRARSTA